MSIIGAVGVREADLPWVDIGVRPGYNQRYQGFFDKKRGIAARIGSLYAEPIYHSPRHRHTFQQVRYVLSGKMQYGKEVYGTGDCLYIPEGAYYGPIKPVDSGEQLHFADIQFEGPSRIPYPEPEEVVDVQRKMAQEGAFEDGIYTFPNGRKRDAYEAILEVLTGQKIEYPQPRLNSYVVLKTEGIPWMQDTGIQGVSEKHLAYFFETGPNLKMLRIEKNSALPAARPNGHRAVFLIEGNLEFGGNSFDSLSYFMLPSGEQHAPFVAETDATLLIVSWSSNGDQLPFTIF